MIYAGGIWTVCVISGLAFGYAWVFRSPRWVYYFISGLALTVIVASQFLLAGHPFGQSVKEDLIFLMWLGIIAIPIFSYAMFVRWAGRKAKARYDSRSG